MSSTPPKRPRNRLASEKSPYLLQHAGNPVDWYPWGDEAIQRARDEDKPIFLSVGYSTCHWCHVMERESFENDGTAALMNELFVNIKVDREEHPDVDQLYMGFVQRMTGQGGWPMSVFLTPDLKPYHAGTYFPPDAKWGRPGFPEVVRTCAAIYAKQRDAVVAQSEQIAALLEPAGEVVEGRRITTREPIRRAADQLRKSYDETWGGFGPAPKFPRSMTLMLLLRERLAEGDGDGSDLAMVEHTLEMMWRGGIYDHLGGGFARYSTDERWLVPHFEKMLYDNALLVLALVEAWQVSKNEHHRRVVRETLDWTLAEMTHEQGGFFSAQDADSEGVEGKFYVWTQGEIEEVLGDQDAALLSVLYGVDAGPNFEGKSILHLPRRLSEAAALLGLETTELERRLAPMRRRLYEHRDARVHPGLDDKVLTSWNGLMIAAMARAGAVFGEPAYLVAAERAADFVGANLGHGSELRRRWRDGEAALPGTLEDYTFFSWGLLELFEATHRPSWLKRAKACMQRAVDGFLDAERGGFFFAEADTPHLIVRTKEPYDGATPSGNSVAVLNLLRLAELCAEPALRELAEETLAASRADLDRYAMAYPLLCCGLDRALADPTEVVIATGSNDDERDAMLRRLREAFLPHAVVIVVDEDNRAELTALLPWLHDKTPIDGRTAAWICRGFACRQPVTRAEDMDLMT